MQRKTILIALVLISFFQNKIKAQFKELTFDNYTPKWMHFSYDSTMESIGDNNGWDHLLFASCKPIVDGDYLYNLSTNHKMNFQGGLLEKINLKSGEVVWASSFDLRNSSKREYPTTMYMNSKNEIVVLSYRATVDQVNGYWATGRPSARIYDPCTGALKAHLNYDGTDVTNYPICSFLFKSYPLHSFAEYKIQYIAKSRDTKSLNYKSTVMDLNGKKIQENEVVLPFKYKYFSFSGLVNYGDYFISHIGSINDREQPDSAELFLQIFNKDLGLLRNIDILPIVKINYDYNVVEVSQDRIMFVALDSTNDVSNPTILRYFVFDFNGNLVEKFTIRSENTFTVSSAFLRNEKGCVIALSEKISTNNKKLSLYKSDGKGNLSMIKEVTESFPKLYFIPSYLTQLDNGDLLLTGTTNKTKADNSGENLPTVTSILFDKDDLGLVASNKNQEQDKEYSIQPNPSHGLFEFQHQSWSKPALLELFSVNKTSAIQRVKIDQFTSSIDFSHIPSGSYAYRIIEDQKIAVQGIWVKI